MPLRKIMICGLIFGAIVFVGVKLNHDVQDWEEENYINRSPSPVYIIKANASSNSDYYGPIEYSPREYVKIISLHGLLNEQK